MKVLSLALRNLVRNRRRSLMTLFAMMLGMVAILLFGGYIRDITYGLQSDYVQRTGHLQIQHRGYFLYGSGNPAAYGIRDYTKIISIVKNDPVLAPMVAVVTPTLQFGGIAGNFAAGVSRTIYASGVVVEDKNLMHDWNDYGLRVLRRPLTLSGTAPDAAVVGTGVARVLQLCTALKVENCAASVEPVNTQAGAALPDDIAALSASTQLGADSAKPASQTRIEILATNSHGAPNVAAVNVVRAEFQGIKELDDVYVALHLAQAQRLIFGNEPPRATAVVLQLRHTSQMESARARLDELLATTLKNNPLEVLDYELLNPFYGQTLSMFKAIFGFISVLISAVVLFTISNTMSMVVVERTVEIGTLRAIGVKRQGIRTLFLTEALVLGVVGSALGLAVALGAAWTINQMGMTWTPPGRMEPAPLAVRVAGEYLMMTISAIGLLIVASISAILPAARASRMNIVDALRHV